MTTVQQELLLQDPFDLEATTVIQAARGSVGAEHVKRAFACTTMSGLLHGRLDEPMTDTNFIGGLGRLPVRQISSTRAFENDGVGACTITQPAA